MSKQGIIKQQNKVKVLTEVLMDNTGIYIKAANEDNYGPTAGYEFDKNSNASKTALKAQITILRNELLKLSKELE